MAIRNGLIPIGTLAVLSAGRAHRLRADAAASYERMAAAFRRDMGYALAVTDAYRDLLAQYAVKASKGFLAATPGTSNHGWGLALDLASGVNSATSAAHRWMDAHAGEYGWVNPTWAQTWKFEPWHWEYVAALDQHDGLGDAMTSRPAAEARPNPAPVEETNMLVIARSTKDPQVWVGDGVTRRRIASQDTLSTIQYLASKSIITVYAAGAVQTIDDLWALGHPVADDTASLQKALAAVPGAVWGHQLQRTVGTGNVSAGDLQRYESAEHANTRTLIEKLAAIPDGVDLSRIEKAVQDALAAGVNVHVTTGGKS